MGMDDEWKARFAAGGIFMIIGFCITLISIPMIIAYHSFAFKNDDPAACYANEGTYEASAIAPIEGVSENIAATWRRWFKIMFWLLLCRTIFPLCSGCTAFGVPYTIPVIWCCNVLLGISTSVKGILFWYGIYLRFYKPGRICNGSEIQTCLAYMQNAVTTTPAATTTTTDDGTTAEDATVDDTTTAGDAETTTDDTTGDTVVADDTTAEDMVADMLVDPCQPPDVFQEKSGKFFIACFIVAVVTCHIT